jgi:hypothetical protein
MLSSAAMYVPEPLPDYINVLTASPTLTQARGPLLHQLGTEDAVRLLDESVREKAIELHLTLNKGHELDFLGTAEEFRSGLRPRHDEVLTRSQLALRSRTDSQVDLTRNAD